MYEDHRIPEYSNGAVYSNAKCRTSPGKGKIMLVDSGPDAVDIRVSSRRRRRIRPRRHDAVAQDLPDQAEAGQETAPEPPHPLLDPDADRQHHQVQREAQALAPHQARVLSKGGGEGHRMLPAWRRI